MSKDARNGAEGLDELLAERVASVNTPSSVDEKTTAVLVFELGGETFAFEGAFVKAVIPMSEPFFVPGCPPSLDGVILHQGEVESVIDISGVLGRQAQPPAKSRSILIAESEAMRSGVRVDRVIDVAAVPESAFSPAPGPVKDALRDLASLVFERGGAPVPLLDLPAVFAAWLGPRE